jgi:hypothetical protein
LARDERQEPTHQQITEITQTKRVVTILSSSLPSLRNLFNLRTSMMCGGLFRYRRSQLQIKQAQSRNAKLLAESLQQQIVKRLLVNRRLHVFSVRLQLFLHFRFDRLHLFRAGD